MNSNPFEELFLRLTNVEGLLQQLISKANTPTSSLIGCINGSVGIEDACRITGLSKDRLYAIHHEYFNTSKPGKKLFFILEELYAYRDGRLEKRMS